MRKNYFVVAAAFLMLITAGCSKSSTNKFSANVQATIGTNAFSSTKNNVNVDESAPVQGGTVGGTEQVTITATSDASSSSYLVIAFGYAANDVKTYNIADQEALCAYNSGSGDDPAVSGSVTITSNNTSEVSEGKHLSGTFDFTTQGGVHVSGYFGVQVSY
ncbi:MAG: hypothetical protein JO072_04670 [Parafilimonas sp.]|nr:hypothetical protein [Parafilimonas sp.]